MKQEFRVRENLRIRAVSMGVVVVAERGREAYMDKTKLGMSGDARAAQ